MATRDGLPISPLYPGSPQDLNLKFGLLGDFLQILRGSALIGADPFPVFAGVVFLLSDLRFDCFTSSGRPSQRGIALVLAFAVL